MRTFIRNALLPCVSCCVVLPALAQNDDPDAAQDDDAVYDEIIVKGLRNSLADALATKRQASLVVEAISSENIGQLPDITIAESLIRLPGINGARDRGNESQAVIRGMGPRLVLGLVNGREVASSEPNRNIRWEIYPSEIVSSLQVYKSQAADLISGGVAGTIDLRTISPLDYTGETFVVRAGPTYYETADDIPDYSAWGSRASASLVGRLSPVFGGSIAVTMQDQQNGFPSFQGWGYNDDTIGGLPGDVNADGTADYTPWGAQTEIKKLDQSRLGVAGSLHWRPSETFELKYDAVWSNVDIAEDQDQTWFSRNGTWGNWDGGNNGAYNAPGASYEFIGRNIVAATVEFGSVTNVIAHYDEDKKTFATGLNGALTGDVWTLELDGSYSEAERENTWAAVMTELYPQFTTFEMRDGTEPSVAVSDDTADPSNQFAPDWLAGVHDGPEKVEDELYAFRGDLSRAVEAGFLTALSAGVRYSAREKNHRRASWNQFAPGGGVLIPAELLTSYEVTAFNVPRVLTGDFAALAETVYGGFTDPGNTEVLEDRWQVEEDLIAAYVKFDFASEAFGMPVEGNFGARLVDVETSSSGYESVGGGPFGWITVDHDYAEVLPSLNLNFLPNDEVIVRVGLARAMARPPLDELRAGRFRDDPAITPPPLTAFGGNPTLDPFLAWQVDLSTEWYFDDEALFAVSLYYKDVDSHIGYSTVPMTIDGDTYALSGPANGDGGHIQGAEITFQTPFSFIPALENFGIYSNYAYVDSNIEEFYPPGNPLTGSGLARNTGTLDLWYSGDKFEARLGYKYHSEYSLIFGWTGSDVRTLTPESILGLSLSYQVNERLGVRAQANNLTNEELRIYRDNDPHRLGRYDEYGRSYLVDFTYAF
ncbi:MAG: TonB-dependent receptor [Woeseiaceae bacterium]